MILLKLFFRFRITTQIIVQAICDTYIRFSIQQNFDEIQSNCLLLQNNGIRDAIGDFTHGISAWVDQIQIPLYNRKVPISDPRRMLLYMTGMIMTTSFRFQHNEGNIFASDLHHGRAGFPPKVGGSRTLRCTFFKIFIRKERLQNLPWASVHWYLVQPQGFEIHGHCDRLQGHHTRGWKGLSYANLIVKL